jgi:hypothetical protein
MGFSLSELMSDVDCVCAHSLPHISPNCTMALRLASNLLVRSSSASRSVLRSSNKTGLLRVSAAKPTKLIPSSSNNFRTMAVSTADTAKTSESAAMDTPRWDLERHFGYDSPNSKIIDTELDAIEVQCKALKAKFEGNMVRESD